MPHHQVMIMTRESIPSWAKTQGAQSRPSTYMTPKTGEQAGSDF